MITVSVFTCLGYRKNSKISFITTKRKLFKVIRENLIIPNPGLPELTSSTPEIPELKKWPGIGTPNYKAQSKYSLLCLLIKELKSAKRCVLELLTNLFRASAE